MKKLLLAMGLGLSLQATAETYVIDTDACAGDEYIYDQSGDVVKYDSEIHTFVTAETPVFYAAYEKVPHIYLSPTRGNQVHVYNTSNSPINFFFRPTYHLVSSGSTSAISPEAFNGAFSSSNSPLNSGGADIAANTSGRIQLNVNSNTYHGYASIYWDSSTCFSTPPLRTTVETLLSAGSGSSARAAVSVQLINNGNNW